MRHLYIPFRSVSRIYSGQGSLQALSQLSTVHCTVVLSRSVGSDLEEVLTKTIKCHQIHFVYKTWVGEPKLSDVEALAGEFEKTVPDNIVAIGGGSLIDAAKVARVLYEHPNIDWEKLKRSFSIPICSKSVFIAVPTTIGAGAEVSSSAVLKHHDRKYFIISHELLPSVVILDPTLVAKLPQAVCLTTMADALSHAIEGYVSTIPQLQAQDYAVQAVNLIAANHLIVRESGELKFQAASHLQRAALYAGYTQNHCLVGAAHALAHAAAENGVDHGLANAFYLPAVIEANAKDEKVFNAYTQLANQAGLISGYNSLFTLACNVSAAAVGSNRISRLTQEQLCQAVNDPGGRANPRPLSEEFLARIEERAYEL